MLQLSENLGLPLVFSTAYHPQSNGLVERGHQPLVNTLAKWCEQEPQRWSKVLPAALWADRVTVKRTTGLSPFRLVYGREAVLPVELSVKTFAAINLTTDWTTEELLEARLVQLLQQTEDWELAEHRLQQFQGHMKTWFDKHKHIRKDKLKVGDMVLLYDGTMDKALGKKLQFPWLGPYVIREVLSTGAYKLRELDGSVLQNSYSAARLKPFFSRDDLDDSAS